MNGVPHRCFEDNCIHAYLINRIGYYDECVDRINSFLPYIDNWRVCDIINPPVLKKYSEDTLLYSFDWMASENPMAQRLGINTLTRLYSRELYNKAFIKTVNDVKSENYYVKLAKASFFFELLIYHYDDMEMFIYSGRLEPWIHNRIIYKALKSSRISYDKKHYLSKLKIKNTF